MSVMRVMVGAAEPDMWATPDQACFHCEKPLIAGELVVCWSGGAGLVYWHRSCAIDWGLAFMRDAWEAEHATTHRPDPGPDKYAEPDWWRGPSR